MWCPFLKCAWFSPVQIASVLSSSKNKRPASIWVGAGQLLSAEYWGEDLKIVCCWPLNNPTYSPTFTSSSRICQGLSFGVLRYNLIASNLSPVPVYDSAYSGLLIPSPLIHLLSSFLSFVPTVTSPGLSVLTGLCHFRNPFSVYFSRRVEMCVQNQYTEIISVSYI